jgi:UDPglucose--hexose-1-phosphate uridylyltransferase
MTIKPELRRDPVTGRWSVIAPERSHRPHAANGIPARNQSRDDQKTCPFCSGREAETPAEVLAYRLDGSPVDGPGWQLRVVPNKFPALQPDLEDGLVSRSDTLFQTAHGFGHAEVVIECPEHAVDPTELSNGQLAAVFQAYRDRVITLSSDPRLGYSAIFKNVGLEAGASLEHTHSQIIATATIPDTIAGELSCGLDYFSRNSRCIFCDIIGHELAEPARVIERSSHFLALAAFAPRFSGEFWVLPLDHASQYETITNAHGLELATLLKKVLRPLDQLLGKPPYNWMLHTGALRSPPLPHFHWHLEVLPRTARPAGLEWGFGTHITTISPEWFAQEMRQAIRNSPPAPI